MAQLYESIFLFSSANKTDFVSQQLRRAADTKNTARPTAPKERVYRILPQHLQDILYEEFNRFKYWKMSTLQQRLQQPASWLRQNLKAIAVREETGPYQSKSVSYWQHISLQTIANSMPRYRLLEAPRPIHRGSGRSGKCRYSTRESRIFRLSHDGRQKRTCGYESRLDCRRWWKYWRHWCWTILECGHHYSFRGCFARIDRQ